MPRPMSEARKAAKEAGDRFYTGGPACHRGHVGERYTSTNACRECVRTQARPDRKAKNPRKAKLAPAAPESDFEQLL